MPGRSSKIDQIGKTNVLKLIVLLESHLLRFQNQIHIFINTHKKFFITEAGVTAKIMGYLCGRMSPAGRMDVLGKGKVNLKIEIEVLEMGIVLLTKEAHFVCK